MNPYRPDFKNSSRLIDFKKEAKESEIDHIPLKYE